MDGFLNLYKPSGFTSHDCVAKLRKILNTKKIGHGGTLDPLAEGVLPIAIGKATRLLQFLPSDKAYQAKIKFGMVTATDDLEGEVIRNVNAEKLTLTEIESYLTNFIGQIEQIPPAYSAIKKDGQKLYDLARKGVIFDIPKRVVFIEKIDILHWEKGTNPELDLYIICGAGTYIRSIARDLGEKLGYGGTLAHLIRTNSCGMELKNSLNFQDITERKETNSLQLIPLDILLKNMTKIMLNSDESRCWCQGKKIIVNVEEIGQFFRTYNADEKFIGISELINGENKLIKPKIVLA